MCGMTKEQLAKRISDLALLRGEFTLRSGRKSNYYLDKYRFETQPDVLKALGKMLAERVTPDIDRLAGPELGAVALAAAASMESGKQIEGVLNKGERVLIIEDVLTTGGQVLESVASLREMGAVVERIVAIIDRMEGARENIEGAGLKFEALFTTKDLGVA
jgi:orotate phosphoribosyltransferase